MNTVVLVTGGFDPSIINNTVRRSKCLRITNIRNIIII